MTTTLKARSDTKPGATAASKPRSLQTTRLPKVALGLLLAVLGALTALFFFDQYDQRDSVVVIVEPVPAGSVVTRDHVALTDAALGTGIGGAVSNIDAVVGTVATHELTAGQILFADDLTLEHLVASTSEVVIGVVLKPGGYPTTDMKAGDIVDIFVPAATVESQGPLVEAVAIQSVEEVSKDGRTFLVSLIVDRSEAAQIIDAEQSSGLHLAIQGSGS